MCIGQERQSQESVRLGHIWTALIDPPHTHTSSSSAEAADCSMMEQKKRL